MNKIFLIILFCGVSFCQTNSIRQKIQSAVFSQHHIANLEKLKLEFELNSADSEYLNDVNNILTAIKSLDEQSLSIFEYSKQLFQRKVDGLRDTTFSYSFDFTGDNQLERMELIFDLQSNQSILNTKIFDGEIQIYNQVDTLEFWYIFDISEDLYYKYFSPFIITASAFDYSKPYVTIVSETPTYPEIMSQYKTYFKNFIGKIWSVSTSETGSCLYFWYKPEKKFKIYYCP